MGCSPTWWQCAAAHVPDDYVGRTVGCKDDALVFRSAEPLRSHHLQLASPPRPSAAAYPPPVSSPSHSTPSRPPSSLALPSVTPSSASAILSIRSSLCPTPCLS
ncbi:hypothetical protein FA95DRAFT_1567807, partial [Auriscalpium vulgare]